MDTCLHQLYLHRWNYNICGLLGARYYILKFDIFRCIYFYCPANVTLLTRAPLALQIFDHLLGGGGRVRTPLVYLGYYWS